MSSTNKRVTLSEVMDRVKAYELEYIEFKDRSKTRSDQANLVTTIRNERRIGAPRPAPYQGTPQTKCFGCGKMGHLRRDCRFNPSNENGHCYKSTPPKWVLDYQKGDGSRWNTRPSSKAKKARKPTIEEVEENESN